MILLSLLPPSFSGKTLVVSLWTKSSYQSPMILIIPLELLLVLINVTTSWGLFKEKKKFVSIWMSPTSHILKKGLRDSHSLAELWGDGAYEVTHKRCSCQRVCWRCVGRFGLIVVSEESWWGSSRKWILTKIKSCRITWINWIEKSEKIWLRQEVIMERKVLNL